MPYIMPREYFCKKCGFEMEHSESINYKFLPVSESGAPVCYQCLIAFITKNVPVMVQK